MDIYLNMNDKDIDNLLYGIVLDKKPINNTLCKSCNSDNLVTNINKIVCADCGMINDDHLDNGPDIVNTEENTASNNYGAPTNYFFPKASLGTKIVSKGYNKLSLIQKQGQMPYKEKSLMEVLETIQSKCKHYGITQSTIDGAKILYKKVSETVHETGKRRGKSIITRCVNRRSMLAACLFFACKQNNETRSPKEIADIYDLEMKHVNKGCRKFSDKVDLGPIFAQQKQIETIDFIERYGKNLQMEKDHIAKAKEIATNIHNLALAQTHEPQSIAAGCILLIVSTYKLDITKTTISKIFNRSEVTISKTYRKISPFSEILMNTKITNLVLKNLANIKKNEMINSDSEKTIVSNNSSDNLADAVYS